MAVTVVQVEPAQKRQRVDEINDKCKYTPVERKVEIPDKGTLRVEVAVADATVADQVLPKGIATGIAFLDHMVDQLVSHGQLAISVKVAIAERVIEKHSNEMRPLGIDTQVVQLVGEALGSAMKSMLSLVLGTDPSGSYTFSAPLDEAFADCALSFSTDGAGCADVALAPYGTFPKGGRAAIGSFQTHLTTDFFTQLALSLGCNVSVKKMRGDNAHHIVESTFKSFGRCLRRAMDHLSGSVPAALPACPRQAQQQRATKETSIDVVMNLDPVASERVQTISTGLVTLDSMLQEIRDAAGVALGVKCVGDLWIDEHHSAEDVMITVGKVMSAALGDRGGLNRMGCATSSSGNATVKCVMDLSNRPSFCSDLRFSRPDSDMVGDVPAEMIYHGFESLVMNSLITVHLSEVSAADETYEPRDIMLAAARAFGCALRECAAIDPRRAGAPASSKGTLSK